MLGINTSTCRVVIISCKLKVATTIRVSREAQPPGIATRYRYGYVGLNSNVTEMVTDSTYGSAASTSGSTFQLDPRFYRYILGVAAACPLVAVAAGLVSGSTRGAIVRPSVLVLWHELRPSPVSVTVLFTM